MRFLKGILIAILASAALAKECGPGIGKCGSGKCCSKYGYCGRTEKYCGKGCQIGYGICESSSSTTTKHKTTKTTKTKTSSTKTKTTKTKTSSTKTKTTKTKTTKTKTTKTKTTKTKTTTAFSDGPLPTSTNGRCGSDYGVCPNGKCCSKYGHCGTTDAYCGKGCQSEFGNCHDTTVHTTTTTTTTTTTKHSKTHSTVHKTTTTGNTLPTSTNGKCGKVDGFCPNHKCCSKYGYCGNSDAHCEVSNGCQSEFGRCGEYVSNLNINFYYKCKKPNQWALSFDDGPYKFDMDLLDFLKEKDVKATFFLNGKNVMNIESKEGEAIVKRMYEDGHVIGSHTWSHADLETLDEEEIVKEMTQLEDVIYKYIGKKPAFMRPPYGSGNGDDRIAEILDRLGYTAACMWNVDTLDWDKVGNIEYALSVFEKNIGSPIMSLNHCFYEGITKDTLINLAEAEINYMLEHGYTPVTMDECLGLDAYQN